MLKSHSELTRWYEPLEPNESVTADAEPSPIDSAYPQASPDTFDIEAESSAGDRLQVARDDTAARDPEESGESEAEEKQEAPAKPNTAHISDAVARAGYSGGWSDWMGPENESVRLPAPLIELPPRPAPAARNNQRFVLFGLIAAVIVGVVAICVAFVAGDPARGSRAGGPLTVPGPVPSAAAPGCRDSRSGATVDGAGPGGTMSGADAILWFQHSYYVERSGVRARQVVAPDTPDGAVPLTEKIQKGIDTVPVGTTYCVHIEAMADGRFAVDLSEYRPGLAPALYKEIVTTTMVDGRALITGIGRG